MGSRDAVRMTPAEVEAFLADQLKVQVGTVGADGAPHLTTLFYVVRDGRIGFWTYARSQKVRNLERDPRVSCLVEDGSDYFTLRGVSITGTAEIVRDPGLLREIGTAVVVRMTGVRGADELGDAGLAEVDRQAGKRVAVLVEPERVATWDHHKMLAGTDAGPPGEGQGQP